MNLTQAYERVNEIKPPEVKAMTFEEASAAVRKMYRHMTGKLFPYTIVETSGNRNTWLYGSEFRVNVGKGWTDLVHMFSHWYHRHFFASDRPHSKRHARIERKLRKWAVSRGWMSGALHKEKASPAPVSRSEERAKLIERRRAQVARLERKIKALTTRLRKAKRSLGALERASERSMTSASQEVA